MRKEKVLDFCPIILADRKVEGFDVTGHQFELVGICSECKEKRLRMINRDHIINDFKKFRFVNSFEKNPSSDMLMFKQIKMNYDKNVYESKLFCYKNGETFRIRTQKKLIISKFYDDYSIIYVSKSEKQSKRFKSIISIQDISAKKVIKILISLLIYRIFL